jgi:hypothetical protein
MTAIFARDLRLASKLRLWRGELIHRPVIRAHGLLPPVGVLAAISPRNSPGATHRQINLSSSLIQFLSDLSAGLATANNQNRTIGKRLRVLVFVGVHLFYLSRKVRAYCWNLWLLIQASRDHHVIRLKLAITGLELQDALNTIWKVDPNPRGAWLAFVRQRVLSIGLVIATGFFCSYPWLSRRL